MKKTVAACILTSILLSLLIAPAAFAEIPSDEPIGPEDFVIRVGTTDFDMLKHDIDVAIYSSGKKLVYKKDNTREGYDYQVKAKEATFYTTEEADYACAAQLTKKGRTARGIKIGSKLSELLYAYPKAKDVWDDGKATYYYYQAPNAPETLPLSAALKLDEVRPDYYYMLIISVNNKTQKVTSIYMSGSWYRD